MLLLVMSLVFWTLCEASSVGGCSGPTVSIYGNSEVSAGKHFNLSCEFTCLKSQHVLQVWHHSEHQDRVSLVNVTSILPNVIVVLSTSAAAEAHGGSYTCRTEPPNAISPELLVQISDSHITTALTAPSTPQLDSTQKQSGAVGLLSQIWYWILLGKTTILLISLATLAVKYKRR